MSTISGNFTTFLHSCPNLINVMCACRLSLLLPSQSVLPHSHCLFFNYNYLVVICPTVNCQLAGFDKKDTRSHRVIHAEYLMWLYTTLSLRLFTIYFYVLYLSYYLAMNEAFCHIYLYNSNITIAYNCNFAI